jgi:hypothetical protein
VWGDSTDWPNSTPAESSTGQHSAQIPESTKKARDQVVSVIYQKNIRINKVSVKLSENTKIWIKAASLPKNLRNSQKMTEPMFSFPNPNQTAQTSTVLRPIVDFNSSKKLTINWSKANCRF